MKLKRRLEEQAIHSALWLTGGDRASDVDP